MPKTAAATKDGGCIASRVQAMRKQTDYTNVNTITSYFGRKRGPKTKYANKKKKARKLNVNENNDILDLSEDEMSAESEKSSSDDDWSACSSKTSKRSPKVDAYSDTGNSDSDSNTVVTSKRKGTRINWAAPAYFPTLVDAIKEKGKLGRDYKNGPSTRDGFFVPRTSLNSVMLCLGRKEPTIENCFPNYRSTALLTEESVVVLQDIIKKRDQINNGVSRKEAIELVCELGQAKSMKQAENHLDWFIRSKKMDRLKKGGKVVSEQATTTEGIQINVEQQLCWHFLIEHEWEYLRKRNTPLLNLLRSRGISSSIWMRPVLCVVMAC